jgi:hypothetical protein
MSTSAVRIESLAVSATCTDTTLHVLLSDGREVTVPLEWFPRLRDATPEQRRTWRLIGGGVALRWEEIDEDVSVASLLAYR